MEVEDDTFVVHGPKPSEPIPTNCLGKMIIDCLVNNPTDEVIVCGHTGQMISYKKILQETCNLIESLRKYGCTQDTFIALCSENHLKFFIPLLAALSLGSVTVPINPIYTIEELKHVMNLTKPKVLFCSMFTVGKFLENRKEFSFIEKIIVIDDLDVPGVEKMGDFIRDQIGEKPVDPILIKHFNGNPAEHVAVILMSSGTTGLPKGVLLTHQNLQIRVLQGRDPIYTGANGTTITNPSNASLGLLPFFHGFGIVLGLSCFSLQKRIIVMKKFDEDLFLKTVQDYKMEFLALAPPLVVFLAKSPKVDEYDLSCIKEIGSGAAPLNKKTEILLKERLKNIESIRQGYGLTECLAATLGVHGIKDKEGSTGRPATFTTVKIRDLQSGKSLGPNKVGEICIKSPLVMKGYYKNEEATKESFTCGGWLKTGDLGYYDEDQFFFVVDRLKELIKYKAFQVPPAELEALLVNHPNILDAGVVGKPDELAGELPVAFIVKNPGVSITEKEIIDYVAERVSPHKKLRGGIIFVSSIPKNLSGKILRRELREMLASHQVQRKSKL